MCGLWGAYKHSGFNVQEVSNLTQLGIVSQLRGKDSAGVTVVHGKENKKLAFVNRRTVGTSSHLLTDPDVKKLMYGDRVLVINGHSRFATCGEINTDNAHPIHEGRIIGCHNGVVKSFEPTNQDDLKHTTDSRILFRKINELGLQRTLDEVSRSSWGSYALAYVDIAARTLNFIRNAQRPLFFMWNRQHTCLYWASEPGFLHLMKMREGVNDFDNPEMLEIDTHYSIVIGQNRINETEIKFKPYVAQNWYNEAWAEAVQEPQQQRSFPEPKVTELKPLSLPAPKPSDEKKTTMQYCIKCTKAREYCVCTSPSYSAPITSTSVPAVGAKFDEKINKFPQGNGRFYTGWRGLHVPLASVMRTFKKGCQHCATPQLPTKPVYWTSAQSFVCPTCLKDPHIYNITSKQGMYEGKLLPLATEKGNETRH